MGLLERSVREISGSLGKVSRSVGEVNRSVVVREVNGSL